MNKLLTFFLVGLLFSTFSISDTYAKRGGGKGMGKILKQLDLSDEQKEKLKAHRETNQGNKELRKQVKELREKMKASFDSNASDTELRRVHSELKSIRSQIADKRFEKMLFIRSILTTDQWRKLQAMKEQRKGKRNKGFRNREKNRGESLSQ